MFKRKETKIDKLLDDLENNEDIHMEALEKETKCRQDLFNKLKWEDVVLHGAGKPEFDMIYGETVDALEQWGEKTEDRILKLSSKASLWITERKA